MTTPKIILVRVTPNQAERMDKFIFMEKMYSGRPDFVVESCRHFLSKYDYMVKSTTDSEEYKQEGPIGRNSLLQDAKEKFFFEVGRKQESTKNRIIINARVPKGLFDKIFRISKGSIQSIFSMALDLYISDLEGSP
jgi:hypothetical protein